MTDQETLTAQSAAISGPLRALGGGLWWTERQLVVIWPDRSVSRWAARPGDAVTAQILLDRVLMDARYPMTGGDL